MEKDIQPPKQQPMTYTWKMSHRKPNKIQGSNQCRERGYRIMFKKRTKRLVDFDAC
uniref:Uncharacterized protein n=1 Tax=Ursus maritimus TaxID=29073 RepID=A0A452U4A3_URSMA